MRKQLLTIQFLTITVVFLLNSQLLYAGKLIVVKQEQNKQDQNLQRTEEDLCQWTLEDEEKTSLIGANININSNKNSKEPTVLFPRKKCALQTADTLAYYFKSYRPKSPPRRSFEPSQEIPSAPKVSKTRFLDIPWFAVVDPWNIPTFRSEESEKDVAVDFAIEEKSADQEKIQLEIKTNEVLVTIAKLAANDDAIVIAKDDLANALLKTIDPSKNPDASLKNENDVVILYLSSSDALLTDALVEKRAQDELKSD